MHYKNDGDCELHIYFCINENKINMSLVLLYQCIKVSQDIIARISSTTLMVITHSTLPQKNGNLPLTFFGGNQPIVLLNNIY